MTRKEAINILNALKFILNNDQYTDEIEEALNIGISALEQTEKAQLSGEAATSDCISRQAAIEIVDFECGEWRGLAKTIAKRLSDLPPAQPERKSGKWISLDDFRGKYNAYGYKCSECNEQSDYEENFCSNCGADMRGEQDE